MSPSKWHAIAKHVPSRTNKDCRKRWFAKMASDVVKGGWAPEEDEKLVQAIEKYGTRLVPSLDMFENYQTNIMLFASDGLLSQPMSSQGTVIVSDYKLRSRSNQLMAVYRMC